MPTYEGLRLKALKYKRLHFAKQRRAELKQTDFTIISNNCWGGMIYESYDLPKETPTVGMFFMASDYIRFLQRLKEYITGGHLTFINPQDSKWKEEVSGDKRFGSYPVGVLKLDDTDTGVEIFFLHYKDQQQAREKWQRRYYAAVYSDGPTNEWCMETDSDGWIRKVTIGGENTWYMLGHTFWDERFSSAFRAILDEVYDEPETSEKLWEGIYIEHLDHLSMKIRKYPADYIFEFDTLDELRTFDESYMNSTHSRILRALASKLGVTEADIVHINCLKDAKSTEAIGFTFDVSGHHYSYLYDGGLRD